MVRLKHFQNTPVLKCPRLDRRSSLKINEGMEIVFFLSTEKGFFRCSIHKYTPRLEKRLYRVLGWENWSQWSPCSSTCDGGSQRRERRCIEKRKCRGEEKEERRCNTFKCQGEMQDELLSELKVSLNSCQCKQVVCEIRSNYPSEALQTKVVDWSLKSIWYLMRNIMKFYQHVIEISCKVGKSEK